MVARNSKPAVATRTSSRISVRLKSSKAASTTITSVTTKSNGVTKSNSANTKAVSQVAKKRKTTKDEVTTTTLVQVSKPSDTDTTLPLGPTAAIPGKESTARHPGIAHLLTINPKLASIIARHECDLFSETGLKESVDPFQALVSGIISQQVSGAAAKSIKAKFIALFNTSSSFPTPSEIIKLDLPTLRTAGLSQRKAEYISGLAQKFHNKELTNDLLLTSDDAIITEKLLEVRGLGLWSIQMFLMFALKRPDVFATGDLGIQRGMAVMAGRDVNKLKYSKGEKSGKWKYMSEEDMLRLSEEFKPYRSILSWYLWRMADTDVAVMKEN